MDPLSDILSLLTPSTYVTGAISAGGHWSVRFPAHKVIKSYSVIKGDCWLLMEHLAEAVHLQAGSCLLLPRGWSFVLASDLGLAPKDGIELLSATKKHNGVLSASPGDDDFIVGSHFQLDGDARFLLDVLPPIVMFGNELESESVRWAVERMFREMRNPQPGGNLIAQQAAYTLLVEALRIHLEDASLGNSGLLSALADRRMASVLSSIHEDPGHAWTLRELARSAGMSRTGFAQTFKRTLGKSPIEYLTHWRMTLAAKRMQHPGQTIHAIALALGYKSESAFSTAFKRHWGAPPRKHTRELTVPSRSAADRT